MGDRFATIDISAEKRAGSCAAFGGEKLGPRLTQRRLGQGLPPGSIISGISIHPAVWPQPTLAEN